MSVTLSRRVCLSLCASLVAARAESALRIPYGSNLRLPLPAPRRAVDPSRALDWSEVWPLALTHASLAETLADGSVSHLLLVAPPAVNAAEPRRATMTLRAGITFSNGAPVTASAVVEGWRSARTSALGRLALSRFDTMNPFEATGESEITAHLAVPGTLDEALSAWPLAVAAPTTRAGVGPFMPRGNDPSSLTRNPRCPTGAAFVESVTLEAPRARNDELRAFTTSALDASWWGSSLYEVSRPAEVVRGSASVVVGMVPTPGGALADAAAARSLERALAALSTGDDAPLAPMGLAPEVTVHVDVAALARAMQGRTLRVAREAGDGVLSAIAERVVALLDAVQIRATLVGAGEASDATLRAVAPLVGDASVAIASMLAASASAGGDEAGASAIVRSAPGARERVAASAWGRGAVAVLGRATPTLHVRAGVRDARFDGVGRLLLGDAWVARP